MGSQEVQVAAGGKVGGEPVVEAATEHIGKAGVRGGNRPRRCLCHFLIQVGYAELRLGEGIQPVLGGPIGAEEIARTKQGALQMAVHGDGANVGESKIAKVGVVPGGLVISAYIEPLA